MQAPAWFFPRFRSFLYGFTLPWRAAKLIYSKPSLVFLSVLPVGITLVLYVFILSKLQGLAKEGLLEYFKLWGWDPNGWVAWSVLGVSKILLFLVSALSFSLVSSMTSSPFNDFLAEKTERWSEPPLRSTRALSWKEKLGLIGIDLAKTGAATLATLFAILFSWIPILNLVSFIFAFLLITFQYVSYPQTRRGEKIFQGLRFLGKHFYSSLGFGFVFSFLFAVPILSSFCLPLAVVGGTLLYARAQKPEKQTGLFLLK